MPLYTYRCHACNHELEARQRMSDEPLKECPSCHQPQLRRVINQVGVMFRGSGFYVTDTKSSNPAAPGTAADKNGSGTTSEPAPAKEASKEAPAPAPTAASSAPAAVAA